ncbi:MAG: hypothetical protein ACLR78_04250 [Roseburia sp.]
MTGSQIDIIENNGISWYLAVDWHFLRAKVSLLKPFSPACVIGGIIGPILGRECWE